MADNKEKSLLPPVVHLVVVDVDGCLTSGEAGEWNWAALQALRDLNRRAKQGEAVPAITLCTGRPEPYVEVLMQAIGGHTPCIYENGCGLYFPDAYRFVEHPFITESVRIVLAEAKLSLYREIVRPELGYFQPGKETSITLYPRPGTDLRRLHQLVRQALASYDGVLRAQTSVSCVDVIPHGIDKGHGVRWLSDETGIPLAHMGGIGDSTGDLKFLRLVGRSAAPANAMQEVRAHVDYVSPFQDGDGVVDIVRYWCTKT